VRFHRKTLDVPACAGNHAAEREWDDKEGKKEGL
jgi:hypothetical protein